MSNFKVWLESRWEIIDKHTGETVFSLYAWQVGTVIGLLIAALGYVLLP